jgi:putative component of toxin-antitoxin plasmid stabilization module
MYTITHYLDEQGRDLFANWLSGLRDMMAKVRIAKQTADIEMAKGLWADWQQRD